VERIGNRLPDPATLFVLLGAATLLASAPGAWVGWSVVDPRDPSKTVAVRSLLDADGLRWILTQAIGNFLDFPPLAGIAAATFGVAGGSSANLGITSLDPLLQGLTEQAARAVDPDAIVRADCNWYFMVASTFLITAVGWFVTDRIVAPRFDRVAVERQLAQGGATTGDDSLSAAERRGLWAALGAFLLAGGAFLAMALIPGGPLTGEVQRHGTNTMVPAWTEAIVPMLLVLFLLPGVAYGATSGEIRSDRCVANRMGEAMAGMGTYVVLAFFAGQAIAWFRQSNLATVIGIEGAEVVKSLGLGSGPMLVAVVGATALLNLLVSSASAKWAFLAPVLVPMLAQAGMRPELVQVAYRVGDSCTNPIAPLNAYLVIILVAIRRWQPDAGIGTLIALLVPYCITALVAWTAFLVAWESLGIPLGPG
jgi:aminobenzoyl-glutamate transport protein